jgi:hypothetical protein
MTRNERHAVMAIGQALILLMHGHGLKNRPETNYLERAMLDLFIEYGRKNSKEYRLKHPLKAIQFLKRILQ